jgi:hypothetical protein
LEKNQQLHGKAANPIRQIHKYAPSGAIGALIAVTDKNQKYWPHLS